MRNASRSRSRAAPAVRNSRWAHSRRRYDAGFGVRTLDQLATIVAFFEERRGRLYGFRWRDRLDWKSCLPSGEPAASDQQIGIGDGVTRVFQLGKLYGGLHAPYVRRITKPIFGSVQVAVDGVVQAQPGNVVCDQARRQGHDRACARDSGGSAGSDHPDRRGAAAAEADEDRARPQPRARLGRGLPPLGGPVLI
jgi:hypothetical protein